MQKIPQELDLLVIGNEPAGLWLLREYERLFPSFATQKKWERKIPRMGWLKIDKPSQTIAVGKPVSHFFSLSADSWFSAEMASSKRLFKWSPENVFNVFSSLPQDLKLRLSQNPSPPNSKERKLIQAALTQQPELLTYAQAIWKLMGRCRKITPEMKVWAALQSMELSRWNPENLVGSVSTLTTWPLVIQGSKIKSERVKSLEPSSKSKVFQYTLPSGESITAKNVVLNLTVKELLAFADEPLLEDSNIDRSILSRWSYYPLELQFQHFRLPRNVQPLTLFLDEEVLPEPDREIWPMTSSFNEDRQKVILWTTERAEFSLESLTDSFKQALKRFYFHFPEALEDLHSQSTSLGVDTCFSEEQRSSMIDTLEESAQELYELSLIHPKTRQRGLYSLLPALRCTLPYPLGTLTAASELLKELFNKKTLQQDTSSLTSNTVSSP